MLRTEFDCPDGLADTSTVPVKVNEGVEQAPKVQILDPATGTGTFLKYVIEEIRKTFEENHKDLSDEELRGEWIEYVNKNLFPRVFGFELLMASYAIAHLKLGLKLRETKYDFSSHNRLGVALTNALVSGRESAEKLDAYLGWLAQESKYANYVKTSKNVSVVVGNPPYLGISENMGDWITGLIEDYKYVDGKHFGEKKHWLQDDYVKFIRFGQWKIDRTGEGILGFITNHSYLDNPTFRGMRQSLMKSFDEIYLLNLHGNSLKKEKCPDGSKDENVFDIRQGVAIGLFIKKKGEKEKRERIARIYYTELWGLREDKYKWLRGNDITTPEWEELKPNSPFYLFVPMEETGREDYEKYWKVTDIFPVNCTGIVTARDKFVIDFDREALRRRIEMFRDLSLSDDFIRQSFKLKENYMWRIKKARNDLSKVQDWKDNFTKTLYRPFDIRKIYFHDSVVWRTRKEVMRHMMHENLGLITVRQVAEGMFNHAYVADCITESRITLSNKGIAFLFPLYIYSDNTNETGCTLNLTSGFQKAIKEAIGTEPTPEEIFYYIYAFLYSPTYRTRYAAFLKNDFPWVPLTSDWDLFKTLCRLGSELVSLHLMKSPELDNLITEFKGEGDNVVAAIGKNSYKDSKLKINKTQYFEGIPEEVYNFQIGGYQVCQKWLKDRKGRELTEEEIGHYQKIVVALNETIRIMKEIDEGSQISGLKST